MNTVYWLSTALLAGLLLLSAALYCWHESTIVGVQELGFPDHFRIQLAVLKVIAAVALIAPIAPAQLKEWAYAGVFLFLLTSIVAHTVHKDPWLLSAVNVVLVLVLLSSNIAWHRLQTLDRVGS